MSKVYVLTNQATRNEVWVFDRDDSGVLTGPGDQKFATFGEGNGTAASTADPLFSQGALGMSADHQLLFAANAGSNDVSCFSVQADGSLKFGDKAGSGGIQPVSVTASGDMLYVLNAGDARNAGTISGIRVTAGGQLTPIPGSHRTVPRGGSHILFSPDGTRLVVIGRRANTIDVYPVTTDPATGDPTLGPVRSRPTPVAAPFAGVFTGRDTAGRDLLAVCSLDNMVGLYTLDAAGTLDLPGVSIPSGGQGSCWAVVDNPAAPAFVYISNAVSSTITSFAVSRPPAPGNPTLVPGAAGPADVDGLGATDMAVTSDHRFLYIVAGTESPDPAAPDVRRWEVKGYRVNNDKLDPVNTADLPIGSQGIAAS